jgi:hypothetical protein
MGKATNCKLIVGELIVGGAINCKLIVGEAINCKPIFWQGN